VAVGLGIQGNVSAIRHLAPLMGHKDLGTLIHEHGVCECAKVSYGAVSFIFGVLCFYNTTVLMNNNLYGPLPDLSPFSGSLEYLGVDQNQVFHRLIVKLLVVLWLVLLFA
jgi:hypothetical protein